MTIYTKKGDDGKTSILKKKEGERMSKASPLIEAIGSIDEVNSYLGIITSKLKTSSSVESLADKQNLKDMEKIQKNLLTIGSTLAGADISTKDLKVEKMEKEIDRMEKKLPKLTGFILPGGSLIGAQLMYARTLVRKTERRVVGLMNKDKSERVLRIISYLNRLSDYLFVLARTVNFQNDEKELRWMR